MGTLGAMLLEHARAAVVPGDVFEAPFAIRLSYACSTDDIDEEDFDDLDEEEFDEDDDEDDDDEDDDDDFEDLDDDDEY